MGLSYKIDEGHVFEEEDAFDYVKFKINELKNEQWSNIEIIDFEDCEQWKKLVVKILNTSKNNIYEPTNNNTNRA
jgi:hypothetical protein